MHRRSIRENSAGNHGDGGRLRGVAAAAAAARRRPGRREPRALAGGQRHRVQAPGLRMRDVGHGEVGALAVRGRAPLDSAEHAAASGAVLPHDLAIPVRVQGERESGLLSDNDQIATRRGSREHRRAAEIHVRPVGFRAVRVARATAGEIDVVRRHLLRPAHRAGLQIERDDRVRCAVRRPAVGFPWRRRATRAAYRPSAPTRSPAPDGPHNGTLAVLVPRRCGSSGIV